MNTGVAAIESEADSREAAQIMFENKFGCLPVVDGEHLAGILTEADFVRLFRRWPLKTTTGWLLPPASPFDLAAPGG